MRTPKASAYKEDGRYRPCVGGRPVGELSYVSPREAKEEAIRLRDAGRSADPPDNVPPAQGDLLK